MGRHTLRLRQTYYNGARVLLKALRHKLTGKRIPIWSTLYLTDMCNQRCTHCGIHTVNKLKDAFDTRQWIAIIDELCDLGAEWFRFLGGEPLLRKDLPELIDYVVVKKKRIAEVVTNGLTLEQKLPVLENLQFVGVSLEGDRENHERVRGAGSFDRTIRGIERCVQSGKYVRLHMVMNRYNIQKPNIDFMVDFCRRNGIVFDFCRLMISPYYQPKDIPDYYYISDEEAREFFRVILKRKLEEHIPISNSVGSLRKLIAWPFSYDKYTITREDLAARPELKSYLPDCIMGNLSFELSSDGKMRLCVNRYDREVDITRAGGVRAAWEQIADKDCYQCAHLSVIEQSLMFDFRPQALWNVVKLLATK
jgi:MoaA/NifB/PqqE/SkfB family radical SAM enzyme